MVDIVDSHRVLEVGLAEKKEFSVPIFLLLSAIGTAAYMMYEAVSYTHLTLPTN